jgi:RNA polymerase sigma-70 factor (ECF subfamily)
MIGPDALPEPPDLGGSILLLRKAQEGDAQALNDLFARYYPRVYRIVRIRMGARVRRLLEPEDVLQQTCRIALLKLGAFQPRDHSSLIAWFSAIAEGQIRDELKRSYAERRDADVERSIDAARPDGDGAAMPELSGSGPGPSSIVSNAELREIYDACVEALDDRHREVVLLRDYQEAGWDEVAARVAAPTAHAAQELYRRAQVRLATALRRRLRD